MTESQEAQLLRLPRQRINHVRLADFICFQVSPTELLVSAWWITSPKHSPIAIQSNGNSIGPSPCERELVSLVEVGRKLSSRYFGIRKNYAFKIRSAKIDARKIGLKERDTVQFSFGKQSAFHSGPVELCAFKFAFATNCSFKRGVRQNCTSEARVFDPHVGKVYARHRTIIEYGSLYSDCLRSFQFDPVNYLLTHSCDRPESGDSAVVNWLVDRISLLTEVVRRFSLFRSLYCKFNQYSGYYQVVFVRKGERQFSKGCYASISLNFFLAAQQLYTFLKTLILQSSFSNRKLSLAEIRLLVSGVGSPNTEWKCNCSKQEQSEVSKNTRSILFASPILQSPFDAKVTQYECQNSQQNQQKNHSGNKCFRRFKAKFSLKFLQSQFGKLVHRASRPNFLNNKDIETELSLAANCKWFGSL